MAYKIILDTDIGDDVDDAYALGMILNSPEIELLAITTVFGNTIARSRIARSILAVSGKKIPVAAGCGSVISPRITYQSKPLEFEGYPVQQPLYDYLNDVLPCQHNICLEEKDLPKPSELHGVDLIIETILHGNGDIIPVTIGSMTNLAMAIIKEPAIIMKIPRIVSMAG